MRYRSDIHSRALLVKSLAGNFLSAFGDLNYSQGELLVLNYHSTPEKFKTRLEDQLRFLQDRFSVIKPEELESYFNNQLSTKRCALLLTFDDGLKNNLHAAEVMEKLGMRAFFFIVPAFMRLPKAEQKAYYLRNIRPVINNAIDHEPEDFEAMNQADISSLLSRGHQIGSHTLSHTLVAANSDDANSAREIVDSKNALEHIFNSHVNSFCSINNTLESVGPKEKALIAANYQFHFTTLPGLNSDSKNPLFIKRRNVECFWPTGAFKFALGKYDLPRWKNRIAEYDAL